MGIFLLFFVILYMGLRPLSGYYFGDMSTYNQFFNDYAKGGTPRPDQDVLFHQFTKFSSGLMNNKMYFLLCAVLYVVPAYLISKKWFKEYWFYSFLLIVGSFSFWAYGTNGIRNGIASSFFLMALSRDRKIYQVLWLFLAVNFHAAMLLPAAGLISTWFYNKNKMFFIFWMLCIPLSLGLGGFWENLFGGLVDDSRSIYLTEGNINDDSFSYTGFRWDFLLYSATGVFAGWYYLYKMKIKDELYERLFNIYLFANSFWILMIRANFSNRFAFLSWFLLALVIVYPWLKYDTGKNQYRQLGMISLLYIGFTYFMNVIVYGN